MHMVVRFIVNAGSITSAVNQAEKQFEEHLIPGSTFDYCHSMTSGGRVAGSDRWTQYQGDPAAFEAHRPKGMKEIRTAYDLTREEYAISMARALVMVCRKTPEMVETILGDQKDRPADERPEWEEYMKQLDRDLVPDRVVDPERIGESTQAVTIDRIDRLMDSQFSDLRYAINSMATKAYTECYLYDDTYASYHPKAIKSVDIFEEIHDKEYLEGKYVVPLDCHY